MYFLRYADKNWWYAGRAAHIDIIQASLIESLVSYSVDATKTGRIGRYINHSRNGNLFTRMVVVDGTPRLALIAKQVRCIVFRSFLGKQVDA
jgi:hypothetical protein